jgi:hypothetical protein
MLILIAMSSELGRPCASKRFVYRDNAQAVQKAGADKTFEAFLDVRIMAVKSMFPEGRLNE